MRPAITPPPTVVHPWLGQSILRGEIICLHLDCWTVFTEYLVNPVIFDADVYYPSPRLAFFVSD